MSPARVVTAAVAALALAACPAAAQTTDPAAAHAAEDAGAAAAAARERHWLASLSGAERAALRERRAAERRRADAVDPAEGGAWSTPFPHRSYGIHAALLPTGSVLFYSLPLEGFDTVMDGVAWMWNPALGTGPDAFQDVDPPLADIDGDGTQARVPIFCSGQVFLSDGRLLVVGGTRSLTSSLVGPIGWEGMLTFNPWNLTWTRQPDVAAGRWYPGLVMAPDGSAYIASGYTQDPAGGVLNDKLERFIPSTDLDGADGRIEDVGTIALGLYPHLFALPGGKIGAVGSLAVDVARLDPASGTWTHGQALPKDRQGATAVLVPGGGSAATIQGGHGILKPASETGETVSFDGATPTWTAAAPLNIARSHHNTVLLPDGGMVVVGGGSAWGPTRGERGVYADGRARAVELREPGGDSWRLGAAQAEERGYHSVALLLPDGRVLSAGDDTHPDTHGDTIELYSPPYLFRGERPEIQIAPDAITYGEEFAVHVKGAATRAVLMAAGATTHGSDMSQRHVELAITAGNDLTATAPASPDRAPPGWYMLFVLDADGVPSVAHWVRLGPPAKLGPTPRPHPVPSAEEPAPEEPAAEEPAPPALPDSSPPAAVAFSTASAADGLPPALKLRAGTVRSGRLRFWVSVDEPVSLTAQLRAGRAAVGVVRASLTPGTRRLTLRVRGKRRRRALVLSATVRDAAGNARRAQATIRRRRGASGPPRATAAS